MPEKKRPLWKKLAIAAGALFGLLIVAIVTIPFFVNVDSYRPQIVDTANQHLNGKLELGKLRLSLWGQIRVNVDGFALKDAAGQTVVAAKDVFFHVPFLSIFSGSPVLTFKMAKPEVNVVKDKRGKMNVLNLVKASPPAAATAAPAAGGTKSLPGVVVAARLGVEMTNAHLGYVDKATGLVSKVEDLNVQVKDISLSKTMKILVKADLDTKMGAVFAVKGPFRLTGGITPAFEGTEFKSAVVEFNADANDLDIRASDLFHKKPGLPTNALMKAKATLEGVDLETAEANFHNARVVVKGTVSMKGANESDPAFNLQFQSNDIALAPWNELVPMLKDYQLEGSAFLKGGATGTVSKPGYSADLGVKSLKAASPMLKSKPEIQVFVKVVTDQVKQMSLTFKAPGNQLTAQGSVISFTRPRFDVAIASTGMDLDQLLNLPKAPPKAPAPAAGNPGAKTAAAVSAADFDAMLDPLRKNEMAVASSGAIKFNLASVKYYDVVVSDIGGAMTLRDLSMALEKFRLKVFGGTIAAGFGAALKPKTPTYRFTTDVAGLNLQKAVESQFALFKNTLLGLADFKMEGTGASFNPDPAKKNLNAKGTLKVREGRFATIDIGKVATEAINQAVVKAAEKFAALKGQHLKPPAGTEATYETISSDFTIQGGVFSAPNFAAISKPGKGIDLRGATTVNLLDYGLKADWEIADTHNITKAKDLNVTEGGVTVNGVLADNGVVKFPIKVTGTCFAPNVNYAAVPEALVKVALNNVAKAAGDKAKAAASAAVQQQIQKAAGSNPQVQKALQGLGKKIFGK